MVYAVIFAGGVGSRMEIESMPKQFIPIHGKPLLIHTLEKFQYHKAVDGIVIACIESWTERLWTMLHGYGINKVMDIVPGGDTGHDSIWQGLKRLRQDASDEDIVLIHDGVRPLINGELIDRNIQGVREHGSAITSESVRESVVESADGDQIDHVPPREHMYIAKAPQSFFFRGYLRHLPTGPGGGKKIHRLGPFVQYVWLFSASGEKSPAQHENHRPHGLLYVLRYL